jgi:hypothetical protein
MNEKTKEYVLMMLGAPVVKIELDEEQIAVAIASAEKYVDTAIYKGVRQPSTELRVQFVQEGALIYAKMILGRIRSKFKNPPGPNGGLKMDGKDLVAEAREECDEWKQRVWEYCHRDREMFDWILHDVLRNPNTSPREAVKITEQLMKEVEALFR